jgi:hypothetical protein
MIERYDLRDEHGRITGHVLRESSHRVARFRSGSRTPEPESPIVAAACFAIGAVMLVATLVYLWIVTMVG